MDKEEAELWVFSATQGFIWEIAQTCSDVDEGGAGYPIFGYNRGVKRNEEGNKLLEAIREIFPGLRRIKSTVERPANRLYYTGIEDCDIFNVITGVFEGEADAYDVMFINPLNDARVHILNDVHNRCKGRKIAPIKLTCVVAHPQTVHPNSIIANANAAKRRFRAVATEAMPESSELSSEQKRKIVEAFDEGAAEAMNLSEAGASAGFDVFIKELKKIIGEKITNGSTRILREAYEAARLEGALDPEEKFKGIFGEATHVWKMRLLPGRRPGELGEGRGNRD